VPSPWELAVEVGVSVASAGLTVAGAIWTFARRLQKIEDDVSETKKSIEKTEGLVRKLDEEVDEDRRQGAEQWLDLNRTLGQIEGMMSGGGPTPPPRGKMPSRGGGR
jgi:hypothetical protein